MDLAPDGRIFVCLQAGQLRVIKNGALLATPFLTLTVDSSGERGLLGIAFDPNFASNNFIYVYYTVPGSPAHNRVSRFTANGDVVVGNSELILLDLNSLSTASNHNGGAIHFGPDGKLYIAVGENANSANSQTLTNLLGKVLRINPDGSMPADNPFFNTATGNNRAIWVLGLRNPFRNSFDRLNGNLRIADVGQDTREELDLIAAASAGGQNFGWRIREGNIATPGISDPVPSDLSRSALSICSRLDPDDRLRNCGRRLLQPHDLPVPRQLRWEVLLCRSLYRLDAAVRSRHPDCFRLCFRNINACRYQGRHRRQHVLPRSRVIVNLSHSV